MCKVLLLFCYLMASRLIVMTHLLDLHPQLAYFPYCLTKNICVDVAEMIYYDLESRGHSNRNMMGDIHLIQEMWEEAGVRVVETFTIEPFHPPLSLHKNWEQMLGGQSKVGEAEKKGKLHLIPEVPWQSLQQTRKARKMKSEGEIRVEPTGVLVKRKRSSPVMAEPTKQDQYQTAKSSILPSHEEMISSEEASGKKPRKSTQLSEQTATIVEISPAIEHKGHAVGNLAKEVIRGKLKFPSWTVKVNVEKGIIPETKKEASPSFEEFRWEEDLKQLTLPELEEEWHKLQMFEEPLPMLNTACAASAQGYRSRWN